MIFELVQCSCNFNSLLTSDSVSLDSDFNGPIAAIISGKDISSPCEVRRASFIFTRKNGIDEAMCMTTFWTGERV